MNRQNFQIVFQIAFLCLLLSEGAAPKTGSPGAGHWRTFPDDIVIDNSSYNPAVTHAEYLCLPTQRDDESSTAPVSLSRYSFRGFLPVKNVKLRQKRQDNGGGIGGFLQTAAQDGIASTSAFTSPTMFIGGFSMMMQPMPNGTEFAGQLMNAIPHYTSLLSNLPGFPGAGRQESPNEE